MRRILIAILISTTVVLGLTVAPADAKPKPPPGCTATSPGAQSGDQDLSSWAPKMTDPGTAPTMVGGVTIIAGTPATYDGGTFNFSYDLAGASCTNGSYTVFVIREDTGETIHFTRTGNATDPIDLTGGPQAIFAGYNQPCIRAHAAISLNESLVHTGPEYELCGGGGGGRIW
jgi:hypothetical protein